MPYTGAPVFSHQAAAVTPLYKSAFTLVEGKPGLTQLSGRWSAPTWSEFPIKIKVIDVLFGNNERPVPEGQWKTTNKRRRLEEMLMTNVERPDFPFLETKCWNQNLLQKCLPISKKLGNELDCRNKSYFPLGNDNFWNWIKDFEIIRITSQKKTGFVLISVIFDSQTPIFFKFFFSTYRQDNWNHILLSVWIKKGKTLCPGETKTFLALLRI